jgi:hypothetical protein
VPVDGAPAAAEAPSAPPTAPSAWPEAATAPAIEASAPRAIVTLEAPFRLDKRVIPPDKATFLADLKDRTLWNKGDMGKLLAEPPPVPGHPAPKVILDVTRSKGPLSAAEAQRVLRARFWIKAVECFSLGAYKDQLLRGTARLAVTVAASGRVDAASVATTSFADAEVNGCLADRMRGMTLPKSRAGTRFTVELQIGHGDEPVAPPATRIVPGDGELAPDAVRAAVEPALPAFEACYRAAFAYAPELWGRLGIRFHVTEKGQADEAFEAESSFPDERVKLCVLRAARKLNFPRPANGDLRFIVPLRFRSDRSLVPPP